MNDGVNNLSFGFHYGTKLTQDQRQSQTGRDVSVSIPIKKVVLDNKSCAHIKAIRTFAHRTDLLPEPLKENLASSAYQLELIEMLQKDSCRQILEKDIEEMEKMMETLKTHQQNRQKTDDDDEGTTAGDRLLRRMILSNERDRMVDASEGTSVYPVSVYNDIDDTLPAHFVWVDSLFTESEDIVLSEPMGCSCEGPCDERTCSCAKRNTNGVFAYNSEKILRPNLTPNIRPFIYECNKNCRCSSQCANRVLQLGGRHPLQLFKTVDKGWGVRCLKPIRKGTFVCEYAGEVIGEEEAERRGKYYDKKKCSYLFDLDFDGENCNNTVDANHYGNVARFLNHSCDANMIVIPVVVDLVASTLYHLALFSLRDITQGEELTLDYKYEVLKDESNKIECKCRSANCRLYLNVDIWNVDVFRCLGGHRASSKFEMSHPSQTIEMEGPTRPLVFYEQFLTSMSIGLYVRVSHQATSDAFPQHLQQSVSAASKKYTYLRTTITSGEEGSLHYVLQDDASNDMISTSLPLNFPQPPSDSELWRHTLLHWVAEPRDHTKSLVYILCLPNDQEWDIFFSFNHGGIDAPGAFELVHAILGQSHDDLTALRDSTLRVSAVFSYMSEDETSALVAECRRRGVTVQAVVSAAGIIAVLSKMKGDIKEQLRDGAWTIGCQIPVNMRGRVQPPVDKVESVAGSAGLCWMQTVDPSISLSQLSTDIIRTIRTMLSEKPSFMEKWWASLNAKRFDLLPTYTVMTSSVGVSSILPQYPSLKVSEVRMVGSLHRQSPLPNVEPPPPNGTLATMTHVHTSLGKLHMTTSYPPWAASEEWAKEFQAAEMLTLRSFARDADICIVKINSNPDSAGINNRYEQDKDRQNSPCISRKNHSKPSTKINQNWFKPSEFTTGICNEETWTRINSGRNAQSRDLEIPLRIFNLAVSNANFTQQANNSFKATTTMGVPHMDLD
ncbi:histone-lysine N-methyltransferase SUV39H2-like [Planoprotostelium fungivorum]|uniref:Histone-lysine N-methyltransferase SUV39H2-like n=1 Tax=Planoprotostelium fungivorum TaxID=1890364 RepID=A0A2P6NQW9_9EUKA|nr:histone-lysine N-methyltransferase SUV39H2-like [Planoprotostelium fungivorum]